MAWDRSWSRKAGEGREAGAGRDAVQESQVLCLLETFLELSAQLWAADVCLPGAPVGLPQVVCGLHLSGGVLSGSLPT